MPAPPITYGVTRPGFRRSSTRFPEALRPLTAWSRHSASASKLRRAWMGMRAVTPVPDASLPPTDRKGDTSTGSGSVRGLSGAGGLCAAALVAIASRTPVNEAALKADMIAPCRGRLVERRAYAPAPDRPAHFDEPVVAQDERSAVRRGDLSMA